MLSLHEATPLGQRSIPHRQGHGTSPPPYSLDFDGVRELAVDSSSSSHDHGSGRRPRVVAIVTRDLGPVPVPVEASGHLGHDMLNALPELPDQSEAAGAAIMRMHACMRACMHSCMHAYCACICM